MTITYYGLSFFSAFNQKRAWRTFIYCVSATLVSILVSSPNLSKSQEIDDLEIRSPAAPFQNEPAARALYDQMIDAFQQANSLSFVCHYTREAHEIFKTACQYKVWLKKPNYFRMETQTVDGQAGGILIGDGSKLWIHWPSGRPQWEYVEESAHDQDTRHTSYMTKPTPLGKHSIWHEAIFLGGGMGFPILDYSTFHGYTDSIQEYVDAVRSLGTETIDGEICELIEVSLMDHQRNWHLWLSKKDHLPRKLKETTRISYDVVTTEKWSSIKIDADSPDSMFTWTPPADWEQWKLPDPDKALLTIGTPAPEFDLASIDNNRIKLSDYLGKTIWLCFWRVGCPPCRKETPFLQELYLKYKDKGLVVLGVNVEDDKDIVLEFLKKYEVTFPNIYEVTEYSKNVCSNDYGGGGVPLNYVIDGNGIIIDAWFGYDEDSPRAKNALIKAGGELATVLLNE